MITKRDFLRNLSFRFYKCKEKIKSKMVSGMNTEQFLSYLIEKLNEKGIFERSGSGNEKPFYYYNNYSSINNLRNGIKYDIEGKTFWIRIPCRVEGYDDIFSEICVRLYDGIRMGNLSIELNTACLALILTNSNDDGWNSFAFYRFKPSDKKYLNLNKQPYVDYIDDEPNQYASDTNVIDGIIETIEKVDEYLNRDFEKNAEKFAHIQQAVSRKKKQKLFKEELKGDFDRIFGDLFKSR